MPFGLTRLIILASGGVAIRLAMRRARGAMEKGTGGPLDMVAKGAAHVQSKLGEVSPQDLMLGLATMAKLTEKEPPGPFGQPAKEAKDPQFLLEAQHWRCWAEAMYAKSTGDWSLWTCLPESALLQSSLASDTNMLKPAFIVAIDAAFGSVVLGVRGTSDTTDMLLDCCAEPQEFQDGHVHSGMLHAAKTVIDQALPDIEKALKDYPKLHLTCVGHSIGAGVSVIIGFLLREKFPDVRCWGFGPPACLSLPLARKAGEFTNVFASNHDIVPRFSIATVERLRRKINEFDFDKQKELIQNDEDLKQVQDAAKKLTALQETQDHVGQKLKEGTRKAAEVLPFVDSKDGGSQKGNEGGDDGGSSSAQNGKETKGDGDAKGGEDTQNEEGEDLVVLHPPGKIFVLSIEPKWWLRMPEERKDQPSMRGSGVFPSYEEARDAKWTMTEAKQEDFEEIIVSPWCMIDHMPMSHLFGLESLQRQCDPATKKK